MPRLILLLLALIATPATAQLRGPPNITPQLLAEGPATPGSTVDLAILMTPKPGWHGYWSNPGNAGQPMRVTWSLPEGATVELLRYPVPQRLIVAGLMNYVFEGPHALLTRIAVPANARGVLPIRAQAEWLACTDKICVPEHGDLTLDIPVATGPPTDRARFDGFRRALPRPLATPAALAIAGERLRLAIPLPASVVLADPYIFPVTEGAIDYAKAQNFRRAGDQLIVELPRAQHPAAVPAFDGLLSLGDGSGLNIHAVPGTVPAGGEALGAEPSTATALWGALLGALLGGFLLNLMPCVFPILGLKVLALARAGGDKRHARRDALGYLAGAVTGTAALGLILLAIRTGGSAVGWAFQLQDPRTILLLFLLATAITLNLLGLFKLSVIGGEANPRGGFATGALAAFVATPCAGPFLGAALGTALLLPAWAGLLVFGTLGLGLALPFVAMAFIPALRRMLPRPGAWMERLQRILAMPMALSAAAALWLLWRQGGTSTLLSGLVSGALLTLGLFLAGRRQTRGEPAITATVVLALVAAVIPIAGIGRGEVAVVASAPSGTIAWSEAAVAAEVAAGHPVFVDFTADWCLTCKVNEAGAIDRAAVQRAFDDAGVKRFVADWTNGDPAITRFLEAHRRAGVPFYLWYSPGQAQPEELPQILTPDMLISRAQAPRRP